MCLQKFGTVEEEYEHVAGEKTTLLASNITNTRQFEIHTPDITIKVNPERTDLGGDACDRWETVPGDCGG